jgi:alkanesulfonate monooxygenase SsuD/methylene tetrahydromethanopterin reductase-like flavin-dependent oxidoreductase (luciferase family)
VSSSAAKPATGAGRGLHLAVALDGAGWHPAAWREPAARPQELFSPGYWADLVREAERGLLDFVTIQDAPCLQSAGQSGTGDRIDQVRGRLDAVLLAARIAPLSTGIGIIPAAATTGAEPFHVASALATLDYVSQDRAGWLAQLPSESGQPGHDPDGGPGAGRPARERFAEWADFVDVVRRLWDSWEDDAVIRDVSTGRFVDRDKLHYVDFKGEWFSVRGPSITPRPPQGQLPVVSLAPGRTPALPAAGSADLVCTTPADAGHARQVVAQVRAAATAAGRTVPAPRVYADLTVFLDADAATAAARKERLDRLDRASLRSDSAIFTGTPERLAGLLLDWGAAGLDGFRLRPGTLPHDLRQVTRGLVPILRDLGVFRARYAEGSLRERLGLGPRPASRYARVSRRHRDAQD